MKKEFSVIFPDDGNPEFKIGQTGYRLPVRLQRAFSAKIIDCYIMFGYKELPLIMNSFVYIFLLVVRGTWRVWSNYKN